MAESGANELQGDLTFPKVDATIEFPDTTPQIYNLPAPTANNEVSQTFRSGVHTIWIQSRDISTLKYSFVAGESGSKFITIPAGNMAEITNLSVPALTLYVQSDKDSQVIELLEFINVSNGS